MLIDVKSMQAGESVGVAFEQNFQTPDAYNLTRQEVCAAFRGRLLNRIDRFELVGRLTADVYMSCARCLKEVHCHIDADVCEMFRQTEEDGEFFSFTGDVIDVSPAVLMNLLLNIPYKVVCADDCKGLCPMCGADLNTGDCGCDRTQPDPRLDVLRTFFPESD